MAILSRISLTAYSQFSKGMFCKYMWNIPCSAVIPPASSRHDVEINICIVFFSCPDNPIQPGEQPSAIIGARNGEVFKMRRETKTKTSSKLATQTSKLFENRTKCQAIECRANIAYLKTENPHSCHPNPVNSSAKYSLTHSC